MRCLLLACCLLPLVVSIKADNNVILRVHPISSEDLKTIVGDEEPASNEGRLISSLLTGLNGITTGLTVGKYINNLFGGYQPASIHGYPLCTINAKPELRQLDSLNYEQLQDIRGSLNPNGVNGNGQPVINCVLVVDEKYHHYSTTTLPPALSTTTTPSPSLNTTTPVPMTNATTTTTPSPTTTTTTATPTTTTTTAMPTTTTTLQPYPTHYPPHPPYPHHPHSVPPNAQPWYPNYPAYPNYPSYPYFPFPFPPPYPFKAADNGNRHEVNYDDVPRTTPLPVKRPPFPQPKPQRPRRPSPTRPMPTYSSTTYPPQTWHSNDPNSNNYSSGSASRPQPGARPRPRPPSKTQLRQPPKYAATTSPPQVDDFDSSEDNVHYIEVSYSSTTYPPQTWHSNDPNNNNYSSGSASRSQPGARPRPRPPSKTQLRRPPKYAATTSPPQADDFDSSEDNVHYIEVSKNFHYH